MYIIPDEEKIDGYSHGNMMKNIKIREVLKQKQEPLF